MTLKVMLVWLSEFSVCYSLVELSDLTMRLDGFHAWRSRKLLPCHVILNGAIETEWLCCVVTEECTAVDHAAATPRKSNEGFIVASPLHHDSSKWPSSLVHPNNC
ncbi:hypothetical protein K470DRAFT_89852 [Piedraia hortae CBS 480.64]|uniref:Secreted protein n=1 Tax=Piedraia hortae CBS 480.64 TaxID=1314780 RepID=A0A6A7BX49_9PEZI|nr:hypothetical protein K470DRAFT_89852 [Piedraia hortae CBS 480.64]